MELTAKQKKLLNRALTAAAIECQAKKEKDATKLEAINSIGEHGTYATSKGKLSTATREDHILIVSAVCELIACGKISFEEFVKHSKPSKEFTDKLGPEILEKISEKKTNTYWVLTPTQQEKNKAFELLSSLE